MRLTRILAPLLATAALALPATAEEQPTALATIGMIADVAGEIGGACVVVETMMGPGIDPHLYQPSAGDVRRLQRADVILYAGHNLEGQLGEVLEKLSRRKPVLAVSEAAAGTDELILPEGAAYPDPHLWMDAALWARTVPPILGALSGIAPDCTAEMETRAAAYGDQLTALHDWAKATLATVPEDRRVLVTAHDAFAYYGRAYGIEVAGIQGVSTDAEAGIGDIRAVVDLVIARNVPAIFVESTINPRTVNAVIEAAEDRGHTLALGAELHSDAMGASGTPGGTYIGMIYENTRAVAEALGGEPAPLPEALLPWAERWKIEG